MRTGRNLSYEGRLKAHVKLQHLRVTLNEWGYRRALWGCQIHRFYPCQNHFTNWLKSSAMGVIYSSAIAKLATQPKVCTAYAIYDYTPLHCEIDGLR